MYEAVERILREYPDLADVGEPQSAAAIKNAEHQLEVTFPNSFKVFLSKWGWMGFGPNEYFGLGSYRNDTVRITLTARNEVALPHEFIVVCDHDGDEYVCLDTQRRPEEDDCEIVVWDVPAKAVSRIRAKNFEDFLGSDLTAFVE